MKLDVFQGMCREELISYLEFLLWHYRVVDAFWFIYTEEKHGRKEAEEINERVWARVAGLAARELKRRFPSEEDGIKGFVQVLRLFPWCILIGYQIRESSEGIELEVPSCASQEARIRRGLGEYNCKEMHRGEFVNFAKEIDPRIRVECLFAPPDPHPPNLFCRWRFHIEESPCEGH